MDEVFAGVSRMSDWFSFSEEEILVKRIKKKRKKKKRKKEKEKKKRRKVAWFYTRTCLPQRFTGVSVFSLVTMTGGFSPRR